MLTFVSRSLRELVGSLAPSRPAPRLRALPRPIDLTADSRRFPAPPSRAHLRVAGPEAGRDTGVAAAPPQVGAVAFVAGQGARIYSLDAFRPRRGPHRPKAA